MRPAARGSIFAQCDSPVAAPSSGAAAEGTSQREAAVMPGPKSFLARLRQRKVVQWLFAYLAGAWLILQALDVAIQNFDLSHTLFQATAAALAVGVLAVLVVAWYHGERGAQRVTGVEVLALSGVAVIAIGSVAFVSARGGGISRRAATAPPSPVAEASVAVLPFRDVSARHDQEYFSDGLTEELLNVLARIPSLRVAARTSSFAFRGKDIEVDSIGRALRVAHVIEGSVRTDGARVRITAQLINARTGYQVWSNGYDRRLQEIFAVQAEIANAIAAELGPRLGAAAARPAASPTADPEAHALLLRGVHAARIVGRENLAEAARLLRQAIARDSGYARAHAELGAVYHSQAYQRFIPPEEGYRRAQQEAERALALDPRDFRGHELLGRIADYRRWDFREAERQFRLALESNPSDAPTHSHRAWMLMRLRRTDEALAEAQRATELDPVAAGMIGNLAAMYYYAGQYAQANATWEEARALEPSDVMTAANLATGYSVAGRQADAVRAVAQLLASAPDEDFVLATAGYVYARAGRRDEAERLLRRLEARPHASPYLLAGIHGALGRTDRALALLATAVRAHDDYAGDVAVDPVLLPLHGDARFQKLLAKAGLG